MINVEALKGLIFYNITSIGDNINLNHGRLKVVSVVRGNI